MLYSYGVLAGGDESAPRFSPIKRARVSAEILHQLKSAILEGKFRPADRLPAEKVLAQQFGSSRTAVREAIRSLEEAGLVAVRRGFGGGAFVVDGDLRHVTDSLSTLLRLRKVSIHHFTEARLVLEPALARLAAERISADELARIDRHIARHAEAIEAGRLHATADLGFHRLVAEASRNPALVLVFNSIADLMVEAVIARLEMDAPTNRSNLAFHAELHEALRRHDSQAAARIMRAHVSEVQVRLLRLLPDGA
jgi:GntR family transcriptional regulator, transcriptional repressor for pyruvate dehydrogenase complex